MKNPTDKLKMGRSVESDVRVTDDISVSRSHAFIKKAANGDYYLEDNKSKFGTLMLVQYPLFLSKKSTIPVTLQSGKTCMSLIVRQNATNCFSKCCSSVKKSKNSAAQMETLDGGQSYFPKSFYMEVAEKDIRVCGDESESE